jgi:hypothetical protein
MANCNPPKKNQEFILKIALEDYANPGNFKREPTLAAGDFKVDIDGAGFNNITTPTVDPAAGCVVKCILDAAEMNGDYITFQAIDQTSPKEWSDLIIYIPTTE